MHESYSHDVSLRDIEAAYKEIYSMGDKPVELVKRIERSATKLDNWKFDLPNNKPMSILNKAAEILDEMPHTVPMTEKTEMKYLAVFFAMILKSISSKLHRTIFIRYLFSILIADELAEERTEYYKRLSEVVKPITERGGQYTEKSTISSALLTEPQTEENQSTKIPQTWNASILSYLMKDKNV